VKIIVDTNIIFSALLKTKTTFGQIIFNSDGIFEFYCPQYMRMEIHTHWDKLKKIARLSDQQLEQSYDSLLTKIIFINEELIPQKIWEDSENLLSGIDPDDTDFVAITKYLKARLWTGGKALHAGLKSKKFRNVLTTNEIIKLWKKKRS